MAGPEGPPVELTHLGCGHRTAPALTCSHCGQQLDAREVRPERGPGATRATPVA